ncbi:MAG: dihydroorotate dehydrogenase-like protein [Chloroflexi bacterium]|nr:dihydroorotate dehydrogenase-like protein [Chloroflexota bacterium]
MANLGTTYMGVELRNPIVAAASSLTSSLDTIQQLERVGAGAIVINSLFEEEIELERMQFEEDLTAFDNLHPEMIRVFPELEHGGPKEHLLYVKKAKRRAGIPVFASLNAVHRETWIDYAIQLADTGVDGLELNFYATPTEFGVEAATIEAEQVAIVREVAQAVSIPVSVKLSAFYTNPLHVIHRLKEAGAAGFVLFNRFFQPDIDPEREEPAFPLNLSEEGDYGLSLRFTGLLYGRLTGDICCNTGVFTGLDVVKLILAGATCVQVASTLYKNQIVHLGTMVDELDDWMDRKGYGELAEFRGKLSQEQSHDPWAYTRAQYVRLLLRPDPLGG